MSGKKQREPMDREKEVQIRNVPGAPKSVLSSEMIKAQAVTQLPAVERDDVRDRIRRAIDIVFRGAEEMEGGENEEV